MKKGDVVTITDGSYTRSVVAGKLVHESLAYAGEKGKHYVVIEVGCSFPLGDSHQPDYYRNDTVIQALDSGKVVFVHGRLLKLVPPTHKVMIDIEPTRYAVVETGQVVEISDKLYKEIKRDLQTQ